MTETDIYRKALEGIANAQPPAQWQSESSRAFQQQAAKALRDGKALAAKR